MIDDGEGIMDEEATYNTVGEDVEEDCPDRIFRASISAQSSFVSRQQ
jgi:hypothetical protein